MKVTLLTMEHLKSKEFRKKCSLLKCKYNLCKIFGAFPFSLFICISLNMFA